MLTIGLKADATPGLKMWGGQQAEPLKGGLEAKPPAGFRGRPLVRG